MQRFIANLTMAAISFAGTAATAALSSANSPVFGQATLTRDIVQGLDWLTPNVTVGLSFDQVQNLLTTDQRFAGFRVASLGELQTLYSEAGILDINAPGFGALYGTQTNVPGVKLLQSLIGTTYSATVSGQQIAETAGFLGTSFVSPINGFLSVNIGNVVLRENVPTQSGHESFASAYTTWGSLPLGAQTAGVGTWLVTVVPEPSSWLLLSIGLVIIIRQRWRVGA